jgi:SIR2-like domain
LPTLVLTCTDYDRHLSTALQNKNAAFAEYAGPALPMGDDFTGLVYLHGSIAQDARHLVCTDKDFGRAWIRDAWAARFLERMFDAHPVMFPMDNPYSFETLHGLECQQLGRSRRGGERHA